MILWGTPEGGRLPREYDLAQQLVAAVLASLSGVRSRT